MRPLAFSIKAAKALRKLPPEVREQIMDKLGRYVETGNGDVRALKGEAGLRLRIGDYRALLRSDSVHVEAVGHRREIYG